ncbi:MAG: RDD family protein [Vicinamibacterales bacterium]
MTTRGLHAALTCVVLIVATEITLPAQGTPQPSRPDPPAQVTAPPAESASEEATDRFQRLRFRQIVRIAQDYTLRADDVARDVRTIFGDVTIEGRVERDVVVIMGSARLGSTAVVEGSLVVVGGGATVDAGAAIHRDLLVVGGTLTSAPGFSPDGEHVVVGSLWLEDTLRGVFPWVTRGLLWGRLIVPNIGWIWAVVGIFFLLYLTLNTVFERPVGAAANVLVERPASVFVVGLLVLLLTVPALAIIAASVIGLAVVPFLLCGLIVVALVGKAAVARAIGRSVLRSESPDRRFPAFASFVLGFGLLTLAYMVPVLGFVTWALTSVLGLGAATITFRAYLRRERHTAAPRAEPVTGAPVSAVTGAEMPAGPVSSRMPSADEPAVAADAPVPEPVFTAGLAQYPRATLLDRAAAFALDCILVAIVTGLLDLSRHDGSFFLMLLGYHVAFWAWKGTTLGGIICNLRVVGTHGGPLRFVDALVRGLTAVFSLVALGIGCLWMLQDPERQMWHDKIAGTLVVKVPREVVLP